MRTLTSLCLVLISQYLFAQRECGFAAYQEVIRRTYPVKQEPLMAVESSDNTNQSPSLSVITIPVVVHVLYSNAAGNISDKQIQSQIDALNSNFNRENADFSKVPSVFVPFSGAANIRFRLATVDPDGRATNGINRKVSSRLLWTSDDKVKSPEFGGVAPWDTKSYLNIWVCELAPGLLGYSSAPGGPAEKDGVVIKTNVFGTINTGGQWNLGRTAVHEVGHWLNLKHLWGDKECGSDEVDDTPQQKTFNQGAPSFPKINGGCSAANPYGDMFMNFMDFTNDAAMMMFTQGQVARMRATFSNGGARQSILASKALGQPWNFTPATTVAAAAPRVQVRLFPNPAVDRIQVSAAGEASLAGQQYSIVSMDGRVMNQGAITSSEWSVSVSSFHKGIYFLKLGNSGDVIRFVKQ